MSDAHPPRDHEPRAEPRNLPPGTRLSAGERNVYEVVGVAWQGSRHTFIQARKHLWNYRFADRAFVEADEDERLAVLVRVPHAAGPGSGPLAFELDALSLADVPWLPEPLDVIPAVEGGGPLLVLSDPHGDRLSARPVAGWPDAAPLIRLARELLGLLDALHRHGLAAGALDPADLVLDRAGNLTYLGTDRIAPGSPEAVGADLGHWAGLTARLLWSLRFDPPGTLPNWDRAAETPPAPPPLADGPLADEYAWLAAHVGRCLSPRLEDRPHSVADLLEPMF
jgi:hypothetical protein